MKDILKRYYQLVLKDRKYLEEYSFSETKNNEMYDVINRSIQESFVWRKINSYEQLKNVIHSKNASQLLKINDYYRDEMCELLWKYLDIDDSELEDEEREALISDDNLQKMVENKDVIKQLKDCIMLEKESRIVCKDMYLYIIKEQEECSEFQEGE